MAGRRIYISAAVVSVVAALIVMVVLLTRPSAEELRLKARRHFLRQEFSEALAAADQLLRIEPENAAAQLLAARCAVNLSEPQRALDYLQQVSTDDTNLQIEVALLEAGVAGYQLYQLDMAEAALRRVVGLDPNHVEGLQELVRVLAVCGRRREAIPFLLHLARLGKASDLLTITATSTGAISDRELLDAVVATSPDSARGLTGLAMLAFIEEDIPQAIAYARQANAADPTFVPAVVDLGRYLLTAKDFDALQEWSQDLPDDARDYPETWQVLGHLSLHNGRQQQALEQFLHAAQTGSDVKDVCYQLSRLLRAAGAVDSAERVSRALVDLQKLEEMQWRLFASNEPDERVIADFVRQFQELGRFWEAIGWIHLGLQRQPDSLMLRELLVEISQEAKGMPLQLVAPGFVPAANIAASDYSLPDLDIAEQQSSSTSGTGRYSHFRFQNRAAEVGFQFRFDNGIRGATQRKMFEFTGGGIGAIDIDNDGFCDLFCSQGCLWQDRNRSVEASDRLFRNVRGQAFRDISAAAGISDVRFGQGVAVGDINNDGFADVFVANIGENTLWLNCGDGTFEELPLPARAGDETKQWTTSALIADLNADGAPDIFAANYVSGADVYSRVCPGEDGSPRLCPPTSFDGETDILLLGDGAGQFTDSFSELQQIDPGKGLGVIAWSPQNNGRLAVMVANDTTPNQLFTVDAKSGQISEDGFAAGLAVNGSGKSEGCMGIACADVDGDGFAELLVTNFHNESNTLFRSYEGMTWSDDTGQMNLDRPSLPHLGFGTHFLDADLDGFPELAVVNGHVDDLRMDGKPYAMPTQLFALRDGAFAEVPPEVMGPYFQQDYVSRAAVLLDWNADGRPDLAVGNMDEDYALLTNTTEDAGHSLSLRLLGATSPRDPIGTTVRCEFADRTVTKQLTSGDGYQCSNEHRVVIGCGEDEQIARLIITWPSGTQQTFENVAVPKTSDQPTERNTGRLIIREGLERVLTEP